MLTVASYFFKDCDVHSWITNAIIFIEIYVFPFPFFLSLYKWGDFPLVVHLLLLHSGVLNFLVAQPFLFAMLFFSLISLFHFLWLNYHYFSHFLLGNQDF